MDQRTAPIGGDPGLDRAREEHLRALLVRLESGELDAYEYARRVHVVEQADTEAAMAEVVSVPRAAEPALDAVDLALLARRAAANPERDRRRRYVWLAAMAVFFVVLLAVGMWLVSHARAVQQSGNLGAPAAAAHVTSPAGAR